MILAINSCGRLLNSLHGSGSTIFVPGFDCDSVAFQNMFVSCFLGFEKGNRFHQGKHGLRFRTYVVYVLSIGGFGKGESISLRDLVLERGNRFH